MGEWNEGWEMVRNTFLIGVLLLSACSSLPSKSNDVLVFGKETVGFKAWDKDKDSFCNRHKEDVDCKKIKSK